MHFESFPFSKRAGGGGLPLKEAQQCGAQTRNRVTLSLSWHLKHTYTFAKKIF